MQFANRVRVLSVDNADRVVNTITAHYAKELLKHNAARAIGSGKKIKAVQLLPGNPNCVGSSNPYYQEVLKANPHLHMLKRYNPRIGAFERW